GVHMLVASAQGIEAQTLSNLYLAIEHDLAIIPVLNKIDLAAAQPEKYSEELANLIGCESEECLLVSGKTGEGVEEVLDRIITDIPLRAAVPKQRRGRWSSAPPTTPTGGAAPTSAPAPVARGRARRSR